METNMEDTIPDTISDDVVDDPSGVQSFPESDMVYITKGCMEGIWAHYNEFSVKGRTYTYAECKYCYKFYLAGTSSLISHNKRCKMYLPNVEKLVRERLNQTQTNFLSQSSINNGSIGEWQVCQQHEHSPSPMLWKYDANAIRKAIAHMLMVDELRFKFVEKEGFNHVMKVVCPQFTCPSSGTVAKDCLQLYLDEKEKLKSYFHRSSQRVSITIDTWTTIQNVNYMVLTAHYVDQDWRLNKKILNFVPINSRRGEDIGLAIESCLKDWGIDKLFTVTVDNASSNDGTVAYLKRCLTKWGQSICDNKFLHVRCVTRILKLIVEDGLKDLNVEISRVRACILWICQSPSRTQNFLECLEIEGIEKKQSLVLDVPTRWNSTYLMLHIAQAYEHVFERLGSKEPLFRQEMANDLGWPSVEDWKTVRLYAQYLEVFYDTTLIISGSSHVTSDNFFMELFVIEDFIREMKDCDDDSMRKMALRMRLKKEKYWGDVHKMNKLLHLATIFDPRKKFFFVEKGFEIIYGVDSIARNMANGVKEALYELFNFYHAKYSSSYTSDPSSSSSCSTESRPSESGVNMKRRRFSDRLMDQLKLVQVNLSKSELERYLKESHEKDNSSFNVLAWWKQNSCRYPILAEMAKDVLAFPISTVTSESAFGIGGRALNQFRSSLSPTVIEALICTSDWLRQRKDVNRMEETLEDLEKLEKGIKHWFGC